MAFKNLILNCQTEFTAFYGLNRISTTGGYYLRKNTMKKSTSSNAWGKGLTAILLLSTGIAFAVSFQCPSTGSGYPRQHCLSCQGKGHNHHPNWLEGRSAGDRCGQGYSGTLATSSLCTYTPGYQACIPHGKKR